MQQKVKTKEREVQKGKIKVLKEEKNVQKEETFDKVWSKKNKEVDDRKRVSRHKENESHKEEKIY